MDSARQYDVGCWPETKAKLAQIFSQRTRDEWCTLLEGTDVCFAPVLDMTEAPSHPHNVARGIFVKADAGMTSARVAPRFLPLGGSAAGKRQR
jgi:alpha-methylacyl-CoA racemase